MNPTPPPIAPSARPAGAVDAPDIFFVLRRYIWLVVIGTLVCTAIGAGIFFWQWRNNPKYTAKVTYQVLPATLGPGHQANQTDIYGSQDEIGRFINRQMLLIKSDAVVTDALRSDEFLHDYQNPNSNEKSRWLRDNIAQPSQSLLHDLSIVSSPTSDTFEIRFTASDKVEASRMANAIGRIYLENLRRENRLSLAENLQELNTVLKKQEDEVNRLETDLDNYRTSRDIDAIVPRHELDIKTLETLNGKLVDAEAKVKSLGTYFEDIKKQVQSGMLTLSSDQESIVENDPQIRLLEQTKLGLDEEAAVLRSQLGAKSESVRAMETRIGVVVQQTTDRHTDLVATARLRMQDTAEQAYNGTLAEDQYIKQIHDKLDREVSDFDRSLVGAQKLGDKAKAQKDILNELRQQQRLEELKGATDDTRIRKFSGDATPPQDISWPVWYLFIPTGFAIGLLLSYSLAYLFELTNTRVRTPNDITRTLQLPLLGFVPDQQDDSSLTGELSTSIRTAPNSMIAESFRQIRGRLIAQADGNPIKTLLVASIAPGGGSTTVASNIANGMALNEMNVLLVDANFYRPGLQHTYKNLSNVGLADVIAKPAVLNDAIVASDHMPNLHVMGTGSIGTATASEMLESRGFRDLLDLLKARFDVVIFDGAPLSLVSDSIALGGRVDGVVAVVRAGEVSRGAVARVREQLRHVRARLLGVVLNAAQTHGAGYFKETYRTFYEYAGRGRNSPTSVN